MSEEKSVYKKRVRKLVRPRMQLKLSLWFASLAGVGLILQFILITGVLSELAMRIPGDPGENLERVRTEVLRVLGVTLLVVLPLTVWLGVLLSFRVAGPLHRMTLFLEAVGRGEAPADCRLRSSDELQDFCELLNATTEPLRSGARVADVEEAA